MKTTELIDGFFTILQDSISEHPPDPAPEPIDRPEPEPIEIHHLSSD